MKTHISEFCYKTGRILFGVFLGLVVLQLIGYWAGIRPVAVVSGSMEPTIKTGSICWVDFDTGKEALQTDWHFNEVTEKWYCTELPDLQRMESLRKEMEMSMKMQV